MTSPPVAAAQARVAATLSVLWGAGVLAAIIPPLGGALGAEVSSPAPAAMSATLYQSYRRAPDIALITESRPVELPAGESVIRFEGVAATLIPRSVQVSGLPAPVAEGDFDYDLFDAATILRKSLGRPAELILSPPRGREVRLTGTLISDQGLVALAHDHGVEALGCGGPPGRLLVGMPDGLRTRPSLSVRARVPRAGRYAVRLSYLAGGIRWGAAYVVRIAPDGRHLDLDGRIRIDNHTASAFAHVPARFVAGDVMRGSETVQPRQMVQAPVRDCWGLARTSDAVFDRREFGRRDKGGGNDAGPEVMRAMSVAMPAPAAMLPRAVEQENLADLKIYRLEEPIRILPMQQKLFTFLARPAVAATPVHLVRMTAMGAGADQPSRRAWIVRNDKASGLGLPLPHGDLTLYGADHGYVGDDPLKEDVALDGLFTLIGTDSRTITFDDRVLSRSGRGKGETAVHRLTLRNQGSGGEAASVRLPTDRHGALPPDVAPTPGRDAEWLVHLKPGETRTFTIVVTDTP